MSACKARPLRQSINLVPRDGSVILIEKFASYQEASNLHAQFVEKLDWREHWITLFGKQVKVPRLTCWYGDPGAIYHYSGTRNIPIPWTTLLFSLKQRIEIFSKHTYNSVLGNYYRNGNDSMGWHSDKEKELGRNPFIASFNLGATRIFKLQHTKTRESIELNLTHGSLLLMGGRLQHHWRHCLPKTKTEKGERINLTFRHVKPVETLDY